MNLSGNPGLLGSYHGTDIFLVSLPKSELETLDISYCGIGIIRLLSMEYKMSNALPRSLLTLNLSGIVSSDDVLPLLTQLNYALRSERLNPNLHIILGDCDISSFQAEVDSFMQAHPGLIIFGDATTGADVASAAASLGVVNASISSDNEPLAHQEQDTAANAGVALSGDADTCVNE